ncbi:Susd and RagB outer membrane lipoprotein [Elizabethkingia miricola]|nr:MULTISPECIES: SusD/RagB family nutrient-binding outer membrane lipoprotein [Elizabethkingia]MCL1652151.1 SusD/RagB family nutrient-binding outer membrane lipoprotein [Elizabethkingia miricola]QCO46887.1 SusD/RagB family nutrient-binding outer membrane lipoprotein [Elizabethkingia sp. 2-6]WQM40452.1 SusD/RagB family nutrient-binding outer membrane lipoprotein [Elizabethkingia miricola]SPW29912.1 Susd and RagB outer membrane lipoprotein [Elizabethkingia miricola]
MKLNILKTYLPLLALIGVSSCTGDFKDINSEYANVTDGVLQADFTGLVNRLNQAQRNIIYQTDYMYQLQNNLNSDFYSGYFSTATGGWNWNNNYFMNSGWNEWIMKNQLEEAMQRYVDFEETQKKLYPNVDFKGSYAVFNIIKVLSSAVVSDKHGPVIYSKFGKSNPDYSVDYDSQQDAYKYFMQDLSKDIEALQSNLGVEDKAVIQKSDAIFNGTALSWAKFANSLKLRLAMRMSYADPAASRKYAEEALNSPVGLIDNNSQNALARYGAISPVYVVIFNYGDSKSGASLTSYLNGYNDPRISSYITKATDPSVKDQYAGVRLGIDLGGSKDRYGNFSNNIAQSAYGDYFSQSNGQAKLFTAAESWFLKAEAALRGYAGAGDAKTNYEKGVQTSLDEWGKSGAYSTYINDATSTQQPYTDPKNATNSVAAGDPVLSTITIKWNDADSFERKLERIITQKWIALYPDGSEAWAEQRRTGYPKILPNIINNSQGTISTKDFIRRIPIPLKYRENNGPGYQRAAATLGGPDTGGTKLWWDKK